MSSNSVRVGTNSVKQHSVLEEMKNDVKQTKSQSGRGWPIRTIFKSSCCISCSSAHFLLLKTKLAMEQVLTNFVQTLIRTKGMSSVLASVTGVVWITSWECTTISRNEAERQRRRMQGWRECKTSTVGHQLHNAMHKNINDGSQTRQDDKRAEKGMSQVDKIEMNSPFSWLSLNCGFQIIEQLLLS